MEVDFWSYIIQNLNVCIFATCIKEASLARNPCGMFCFSLLFFFCVDSLHLPAYQRVQTSIFIFHLQENSLIWSIIILKDEQAQAEVASTSSKAGMFLITGFYSSPVPRDAHTSGLKSHGWWLSAAAIWFCDLCPSKHRLIWFCSSFIRENTLDELSCGSGDARVRIYRV